MPKRKADADPSHGQVVIRDIGPLKALADPLRLRILVELGDREATVKEIAAGLGVPPTRLYYHFKLLQRAKLIRVAGRRMVSGIEERRYRATATSWTIDPEATPVAVESGIIGALLSMVRAELELALSSAPTTIGDPAGSVPFLSLTRLVMSQKDVTMFQRRVGELIERFGQDEPTAPGKREYHAVFATYVRPGDVPSESRPATSSPSKAKPRAS